MDDTLGTTFKLTLVLITVDLFSIFKKKLRTTGFFLNSYEFKVGEMLQEMLVSFKYISYVESNNMSMPSCEKFTKINANILGIYMSVLEKIKAIGLILCQFKSKN